jgi:formylglycine-generating enzyme
MNMRGSLVALGLLGMVCPVIAEEAVTGHASHADAASPACATAPGEVYVPAGRYEPFFKGAQKSTRSVGPMCVSAAPVTYAEYAAFVRAHPEWRKSQVTKLFAEDSYLADWKDDFTPPPESLQKPVTFVSWFAAGAFCEARGARLPKVAEWERFAGATAPAPAKAQAGTAGDTPFRFAMGHPTADLAATPLELPGIWEWTSDFNSAVVAGRIGNAEDTDAAQFCGAGFRAVDPTNYAAFLRYSFRSSLRGDFALRNLGFRCAREAS